jgi:hypothetical protein
MSAHEVQEAVETDEDETVISYVIEGLPCMADHRVYSTFMQGHFGRRGILPAELRGLQAFLPQKDWLYDHASHKPGQQSAQLTKTYICQALSNFEKWLRLVGGREYRGITMTLVERLERANDMGADKWQPGYIRYTIEHVVEVLLGNLRTKPYDVYKSHEAIELRGCDITVASGVAKALPLLWDRIKLSMDDQKEWSDRVSSEREANILLSGNKRAFEEKKGGYRGDGLEVMKPLVGGGSPGGLSMPKIKVEAGCIRQLQHELGFKGKDGKIITCRQGDKCKFAHVPHGSPAAKFVECVQSIDDKFLPANEKEAMISRFLKRA